MLLGKIALALLLAQGAFAQSVKSSRVLKPATQKAVTQKPAEPQPTQTGIVSMNRNWIMSLIEVDGEQLKLNVKKLRAMQARDAGSLKGMCPAGQEFKEATIDFSASNATVADAHLTAFSTVIGSRWQVVPLPEYGRDYNPQYIKLDRNVTEIRTLKQNGDLTDEKLKILMAQQNELVQQLHQSSAAHLRVLIQKMQTAEPPKKSGAVKLPFPIRYTCQVKENTGSTTENQAADEDAVQ